MKVIILAGGTHKWLWKALSLKLSKKSGASINIFVSNNSMYSYYEGHCERYKKIKLHKLPNIYDKIINSCLDYDVNYKDLKYFEKNYACNIIKDMVFSDRQIGSDYYISAPNHAKSKIAKKANLNSGLNGIKISFELWEKKIQEIKPNLIILSGGMYGIYNSPLKFIAKKKNIPVRVLTSARIEDYYYWATDELGHFTNELKEKVKNFKNANIVSSNELLPVKRKSDLTDEVISAGFSSTSLGNLIFLIIKKIRSIVVSFFKNKQKFKQGISFFTNLKYLFNGVINQKYNDFFAIKSFKKNDLKTKVFFPLQQVPEFTSLNHSWAHDQLNIILECSLALPVNCKMIVKEHYFSMNVRNLDFYRFISRLPNVELAHPSISGKFLAENCQMVISISSTALYEAALFGKPILSFQYFNHISYLPHVYNANSQKDIKKIKKIISKHKSKTVQVKAVNDAIKMQNTIKKNFFSLKGNLGYIDLNNFKASFKSASKIEKIEGDKLIKALSKSKILEHLYKSLENS